MLCYRDRTFCPFYEDCTRASECDRPLTDKVKDAAKAWWDGCEGEPPIATYVEKPECHSDNKKGYKDEGETDLART